MTRPERGPSQWSSSARAMAADALPAPMTKVRPGGSGGRWPGRQWRGCADSIAASNSGRSNSGDAVAGTSFGPGIDILRELIDQNLHRLVRRPRDVRCDDEVRLLELEQGIAVARWLDGEHVDGCTGDPALAKRAQQRRLIDETAAGRVDENGIGLHRAQLALTDQTAGIGVERTMQRQYVRLRQQLGEGKLAAIGGASAHSCGELHAHAKPLAESRGGTADGSATDNHQ